MFSLGPWAALLQPEFHVLRPTQDSCSDRDNIFAYGTFTLYGWLSQYPSTHLVLDHCPENLQLFPATSSYPGLRNACRLARNRFRLLPFRSPLLRESLRFLFYPATEMFHFADFAPALRVSGLRRRGCPIRTSSDLRMFAPPRSFSQLTASFLADKCQGILRAPLMLFSPLCHCLLFSCQVPALKYMGKIENYKQAHRVQIFPIAAFADRASSLIFP